LKRPTRAHVICTRRNNYLWRKTDSCYTRHYAL